MFQVDNTCSAVTVGSIYHHFAGKDDVFEQLVREAMTEYLAGLIDALEERGVSFRATHWTPASATWRYSPTWTGMR